MFITLAFTGSKPRPLTAEATEAPSSNPDQKLFAARPTSQELQHAETFITGMEGVFAQADKDAAQDEAGQVSSRHQALALYAQTLFASNRFLYID